MSTDLLTIADKTFTSRLIVGTGKYPSHSIMAAAHRASGAEMVTVAVRRVNLTDRSAESLLSYIDQSKIFLLPNTAGCYTADDAIRTARLGREVGLSNWVKLEVIGDERTLFPDNVALLEATRVLVREGFVVLPYTNDDPVICRKLEEAGAAAVMPLGAPIGSGLGIQNPNNISIIREQARVPVIVDAGVGTASDAAIAMELGADGVLMNTAIALAAESGRDGDGDEARGRSGPPRVRRRPDPATLVRVRQQPGRRQDRRARRLLPAASEAIVSMESLEQTLQRLDRERDEADRRYNEALTALDRVLPKPAEWPSPRPASDDSQLASLNGAWDIAAVPPAAGSGWRGRLAGLVWRTVAPYLQQQASFNARLVDHLNRNAAAARDAQQRAEETVARLREESARLAEFHARLIRTCSRSPRTSTRAIAGRPAARSCSTPH